MIMLSFTANTRLIDVQGADASSPDIEIQLSPELKEKMRKVARSTVRKNVVMFIFYDIYDMLHTVYYPSIDLTGCGCVPYACAFTRLCHVIQLTFMKIFQHDLMPSPLREFQELKRGKISEELIDSLLDILGKYLKRKTLTVCTI